MNDEAVVERYGIHAKQYPDLAALVGETSDNLPGIPGVGPKTAAKWLQSYGDLDTVLASSGEIPGKVGESLRANSELAVRNRRLNHLVRDLDLGLDFETLRLTSVDEVEVRKVFTKMHFKTLTERVLRLRGQNGTQTNGLSSAPKSSEPMVQEEIEVRIFDTLDIPAARACNAAEVSSWLSKQSRVGFELEEADDTLLMGFASADERLVLTGKPDKQISDWLSGSSEKALFDLKGTRRILLSRGLEISGVVDDVLLLAYLLNPVRRNYYVDDIALEQLGLSIQRSDPNQLIPEAASDPSLDAWLAFSLAGPMRASVEKQGQLKLYESIELPSSITLSTMESQGISIDTAKLETLFESLSTEVAVIAKDAYKIIGKEINLASPKQLQTVLFDEL
jgi:DNA polymerase-1